MNSELDIKTERIRQMLERENLGGVIINAQHNFAWLTCGKSNGINSSTDAGVCSVLVRRDGRRFLLSNNIEMRRMLVEQISESEFEPVEFSWQEEKANGRLVIEKAQGLIGSGQTISSDLALDPSVRTVEGLIAKARYDLTPEETSRYRELGRDAGEIVGELFASLTPGQSELEVASVARNALAARNIESIVTLVGADDRIGLYRHPLPTSKIWREKLMIVVCARRHGLIASLSRIAVVGQISSELRRRTEAAAYVYANFVAASATGMIAADIYREAARAYAEKGFDDEIDKHHQGGATGYKSRDWTAHPTSAEVIAGNQAFAWNPSITGTKCEETIIVNGIDRETITRSPNFPAIEVRIGGEYFSAPGILTL